MSKDQKEVDEPLAFARRGESGDGTLGKNLCGCEEVEPKFEVASMFECSLPPVSMVNIVSERKYGRPSAFLPPIDGKTRRVRDSMPRDGADVDVMSWRYFCSTAVRILSSAVVASITF